MFYLTMHSTHFIYGYMASDIWLRTILIVRKETRCRHIGYSFRLAIYGDAEGVLLVDYLDKRHTITGDYYADLPRQPQRQQNQADSAWKADKRSVLPPGQCFGTQWPWPLSRNVDSNLSKTHPILLIWLPLTTTSSRK